MWSAARRRSKVFENDVLGRMLRIKFNGTEKIYTEVFIVAWLVLTEALSVMQ
jgi:hypothetical protein